jgi:hypothetical protein
LHNKKLYDLSLSDIRMFICRRMKWPGLVARTGGGKRSAYRVLVGTPQRKRTLGRPRLRWENDIKENLKGIGWGVWTGLIWLRTETGGGLL